MPRFDVRSLLAMLAVLLSLGTRAHAGERSLCCPADLDGDGIVAGADLTQILGAWGPAAVDDPADLDRSGAVDGADLTVVLGSWGACPNPCLKTIVVGSVQLADGSAVPQAVVVTQRGGSGVTGSDGTFAFEVEVGAEITSLTVSAVASIAGTTYAGSTLASPVVHDGVTDAGAIIVSAESGCGGAYGWLPGFEMRGMNSTVSALAVYDDGTGPALYAGGVFTAAGNAAASLVAKWDGTTWSAVGESATSAIGDSVSTLAVFDDGTGPALYAGGDFVTLGGVPANRVAKWNGTSWSSLGEGAADGTNGWVAVLEVFDDGTGPRLYAGGQFTAAGGATANRIATWNGIAWAPLVAGGVNGLNGSVLALATFEHAGSTALYVGGAFTTAGDVTANRIAKWSGSAWSALGTGTTNGVNDVVGALAVFDAGTGPALYVGGSFWTAGGAPAGRIARWNGTAWAPLGAGLGTISSTVRSLAVFDDGTGSALYAGGFFTTAGGITANRVARWDGTVWSSLGVDAANGLSYEAYALLPFDGGRGPELVVGGSFDSAGGVNAERIATWNGRMWAPMWSGDALAVSDDVYAMTVFDDGNGGGPALYVGGSFSQAGGVLVRGIARWDGASWSALGAGMTGASGGIIHALTVFDDGIGGPALYAGGIFSTAGGVAAKNIAKWDGRAWSALGTGMPSGSAGAVYALAVFDDGRGPKLYAGGNFVSAGGVPAVRIARWNGGSWSAVGTGMSGSTGAVRALAVFDDGSGPALVAGGAFTTAGGLPANRVAAWDGAAWHSLGTNAANGLNGTVRALAVFDAGATGDPLLYVGGEFTTAGGAPANNIATWDGSAWSPLVSESVNGVSDAVYALSVFNNGSGGGSQLYVAGTFTDESGGPGNNVVRWNGSGWSSLGSGPTSGVNFSAYALTVFDSALHPPALYVGGVFTLAGGMPSHNIGAWGCIDGATR